MKLRRLCVLAVVGTILSLMPGCEGGGDTQDRPADYWKLKQYVGTMTCTRMTATAQWGARGSLTRSGQQFPFSISLYAPANSVSVITKISTGSVMYSSAGYIVKWTNLKTIDWSMRGEYDLESSDIDFDFIHMHLTATYDDNQISGTITASDPQDGRWGDILFEDTYTFTATRQADAE